MTIRWLIFFRVSMKQPNGDGFVVDVNRSGSELACDVKYTEVFWNNVNKNIHIQNITALLYVNQFNREYFAKGEKERRISTPEKFDPSLEKKRTKFCLPYTLLHESFMHRLCGEYSRS